MKKYSFAHLGQATKGKVKETTGRLVGSARLEERGAMQRRASALRNEVTQMKRLLKSL